MQRAIPTFRGSNLRDAIAVYLGLFCLLRHTHTHRKSAVQCRHLARQLVYKERKPRREIPCIKPIKLRNLMQCQWFFFNSSSPAAFPLPCQCLFLGVSGNVNHMSWAELSWGPGQFSNWYFTTNLALASSLFNINRMWLLEIHVPLSASRTAALRPESSVCFFFFSFFFFFFLFLWRFSLSKATAGQTTFTSRRQRRQITTRRGQLSFGQREALHPPPPPSSMLLPMRWLS